MNLGIVVGLDREFPYRRIFCWIASCFLVIHYAWLINSICRHLLNYNGVLPFYSETTNLIYLSLCIATIFLGEVENMRAVR